MEVYKFGGASVKDANGVKNLGHIIKTLEINQGVIVISAMGKMTNHFEKIVASYVNQTGDLKELISETYQFHIQIIESLFERNNTVVEQVSLFFEEITNFTNSNDDLNYNFIYDQIVSKAELISTTICSAYLIQIGIENNWQDARNLIATNNDYRRAKVNWAITEGQISKSILKNELNITQGFIAGGENNCTTTLGREGSDYTAGILAYCLNASKVSIFKDVPGVLNADPRVFNETQLLEQISYKEAIEMAFYGASVIHPKTLQPLQRKEIPLNVRSFKNPKQRGTVVTKGADLIPKTPCFIVKKNQILLSLSAKDFSFMMEDDISEIFDMLHQFKIKVNLIQNSAISFSVCLEDPFNHFDKLFEQLKLNYICLYNKEVSLYTIRHYTKQAIKEIEHNQTVLVKQWSRETVQLITKTK